MCKDASAFSCFKARGELRLDCHDIHISWDNLPRMVFFW